MKAEASRPFELWVGPLTAVAATAAMLIWTWGKWPEVLVDFGRELYVPWRIASGDALYRDVAWFDGPLSPYLNALWFKLFGVGLWTLVAGNLVIAGLIAGLMYRLLLDLANRWAAATALLVFVLIFAFNQYDETGGFNYLCPHSHDIVHGLLLSLACIGCLRQHILRERAAWLLPAGILLGATWLTRPEIFLAALAAVVTAVIALNSAGRRIVVANLLALAIGAIVVPAVAFLLLLALVDAQAARQGVLGAWPHLFDAGFRSMPVHATRMGTDSITFNIMRMLTWLARYASVLAPAVAVAIAQGGKASAPLVGTVFVAATALFYWCAQGLDLPWLAQLLGLVAMAAVALARGRHATHVLAVTVFAVTAVLLTLLANARVWLEATRPLPLLLLVVIVVGVIQIRRKREDPDEQAKLPSVVLRQTLAVFCLVLLARIILAPHIRHDGFAYAMPACLLLTAALLDWLPRWIGSFRASTAVIRSVAMATILVATVHLVGESYFHYREKNVTVGTGADRFVADRRGAFVQVALAALSRTHPDDTVIAVPDGVMINYLARRASPGAHYRFMPHDMLRRGEQEVLEDLERDPPDFLVLVHRDTSEFGPQFFGRDYAIGAMRWISRSYRKAIHRGDRPLDGPGFGISVHRHQP